MYRPIPKVPDFPAIEREVLRFWAERRIFEQLRRRNAGGPRWSFLDGPITANNPMGVHHAWGRSYKDMFQRYHAMMGRDQRYQNGFDCQGLWVEVEVEKSLAISDRHQILDYGIDHFVRRCKERVLTYAARQTEQSIRLGQWCDWDDPAMLRRLQEALADGREEVTITVPSGAEVTGAPEEIVARLGSAEWGGSYFTLSDENNYTIWSFLQKCHREGHLYRGTDVMPWCARCGTGLSQMEVSDGRRITSHTSVFVRLPLLDDTDAGAAGAGGSADAAASAASEPSARPREYLLVWTTTPWTLAANVAVAVNPEMTYLRVRHGGENVYYLGKENFTRERVQQLEAAGRHESHRLHSLRTILEGSGGAEVLGEVRGAELLGRRYGGPFDHLAAQRHIGGVNAYGVGPADRSAAESHRVIPWSEVSGAEGTGLVNIAPGCGAEDAALGREHELPVLAPLGGDGRYLDGFGELSGRLVFEVADDIVRDLKQRGLLVAKEAYPHVYPHCWRCKQELVFRLVDEWFIDMSWRDRIQRIVGEVVWIPEEGAARELDWLRNMGDWMISKKRFWGLALPIWVCGSCKGFSVVGSREELRQRAVAGWDELAGHTPHRPWIDRVKLRCDSCGGVASRVEDVGNPWLDAGIVPFSTLQFSSDRDYWQRWFPADLVVESFPGQFRNWFYALLAMSAMMDGRAPFRRLLGHASVLDARGQEMHKSAGNAIAFDEAAETIGAEPMRYMYAARNPVQNLLFPDLADRGDAGARTLVEVRRRLLTLWNCYSFFITYATVDGWQPPAGAAGAAVAGAAPPPVSRSELDRWILSRLQRLIGAAHLAFADAALYRFMAQLEAFADELSNWYLRRSRRRFWGAGDGADKQAAFHTLYEVLATLVRLAAPILPFLSEEIYQNLVRGGAALVAAAAGAGEAAGEVPESVHLTAYPQVDTALIDEGLESEVDCVIRIKNLGLALRSEAKVKTRQPLGLLVVRPRDAADRATLEKAELTQQVLDECNVKELRLIDDERSLVAASVRPNFKALGPRYGRSMKEIAAHLSALDAAVLERALAADGAYRFTAGGEPVEVLPGDVTLVRSGPENLVFLTDQGSFAALDTTVTPALEREGIARDFNRHGQEQRKALDLAVTDRVEVEFAASPRVRDAVAEHAALLCEELLADRIVPRDQLDGAGEAKIAGEVVLLVVRRVS
jgi:isoleucyl-tRNA synthetase